MILSKSMLLPFFIAMLSRFGADQFSIHDIILRECGGAGGYFLPAFDLAAQLFAGRYRHTCLDAYGLTATRLARASCGSSDRFCIDIADGPGPPHSRWPDTPYGPACLILPYFSGLFLPRWLRDN